MPPFSAAPMATCCLCAFIAHYWSQLKQHRQMHSREKPFHCGFCPYTSAQLFNLIRNTRTYTGEKSYRHPHCPLSAPAWAT